MTTGQAISFRRREIQALGQMLDDPSVAPGTKKELRRRLRRSKKQVKFLYVAIKEEN